VILRHPLVLDAQPEAVPTPAHFRKVKPELGATILTFAVFSEPQRRSGSMPTHYRFEDAPDAEMIAGGIHNRHPDAPSIARHGAFVSWGFEGSPEHMTETGRRLFLNVLAYASAHRGKHPGVLVETKARQFSRLAAEDLPYAHAREGGEPAVDEDVRGLQVPNDSPAFLDLLATRLAREPHDSVALTLTRRYLPDAPVPDLRSWLDQHTGELFFSDWGGYRWYLREEIARAGSLDRPSPK